MGSYRIKTSSVTLEARKIIWESLSVLYLDIELNKQTFRSISEKIQKSPFTYSEIVEINKYELFPVLYVNLVVVAGEWAGFDEKFLEQSCLKSYQNRKNVLNRLKINLLYLIFGANITKDLRNIQANLSEN